MAHQEKLVDELGIIFSSPADKNDTTEPYTVLVADDEDVSYDYLIAEEAEVDDSKDSFLSDTYQEDGFGKGFTWPDSAVKLLLSSLEELRPKVGRSVRYGNKTKMWREILRRFEDKGHRITLKQLMNKYTSLLRQYKRTRVINRGPKRSRPCPFEKELERILVRNRTTIQHESTLELEVGGRPNGNSSAIESTAPTKSSDKRQQITEELQKLRQQKSEESRLAREERAEDRRMVRALKEDYYREKREYLNRKKMYLERKENHMTRKEQLLEAVLLQLQK